MYSNKAKAYEFEASAHPTCGFPFGQLIPPWVAFTLALA